MAKDDNLPPRADDANTKARRDKHRKVGKDKAKRTHDAVKKRLDRAGVVAVKTIHGDVQMDSITFHEDTEGNAWVEVYVGGETANGDPHFRVFNPPMLVTDPLGDIEIAGRRFREDPVAALAEALGSFGANRIDKKKGRP